MLSTSSAERDRLDSAGGLLLGILSGLAKATFAVAAVAVAGPLLLPVLMSGDMSGIDGYCDDE